MGVTTHFYAFDPAAYAGAERADSTPRIPASVETLTAERAAADAKPGSTAENPGAERPRNTGWPTVAGLAACGDLVDLETSAAPGRLRVIDSDLGGNKRWYDNLEGDRWWRNAREHLPEPRRSELDAWLGHLFYRDGECPCGLTTIPSGPDQVVYPPALLAHLVTSEAGFWGYEDLLDDALGLDHAASLEHLRWRWVALLGRAHAAGPGWALLRYIWY